MFRFPGPNRQNLRIEDDFANASNVLFEDKGPKGVFTWNDGNSTYKLVVKTDGTSDGGNNGGSGGGLVLGPPAPDLQYLVSKSRLSSAIAFLIRGSKYVSETKVPQGTLTYMLDKKRCVAFLSSDNLYRSIMFAQDSQCQRSCLSDEIISWLVYPHHFWLAPTAWGTSPPPGMAVLMGGVQRS